VVLDRFDGVLAARRVEAAGVAKERREGCPVHPVSAVDKPHASTVGRGTVGRGGVMCGHQGGSALGGFEQPLAGESSEDLPPYVSEVTPGGLPAGDDDDIEGADEARAGGPKDLPEPTFQSVPAHRAGLNLFRDRDAETALVELRLSGDEEEVAGVEALPEALDPVKVTL